MAHLEFGMGYAHGVPRHGPLEPQASACARRGRRVQVELLSVVPFQEPWNLGKGLELRLELQGYMISKTLKPGQRCTSSNLCVRKKGSCALFLDKLRRAWLELFRFACLASPNLSEKCSKWGCGRS